MQAVITSVSAVDLMCVSWGLLMFIRDVRKQDKHVDTMSRLQSCQHIVWWAKVINEVNNAWTSSQGKLPMPVTRGEWRPELSCFFIDHVMKDKETGAMYHLQQQFQFRKHCIISDRCFRSLSFPVAWMFQHLISPVILVRVLLCCRLVWRQPTSWEVARLVNSGSLRARVSARACLCVSGNV